MKGVQFADCLYFDDMKKFLKKFWWIILTVLAVGGFFIYGAISANAKAVKENSYTVKKTDLTEELSLSGEIDAEEKASLRFQTSGLMTWVGVKEGDSIKKYQALASLDKRDLQNQMTKLLNTYSKTRDDFEQAQSDNEDWQTEGMTDEAREAVKRSMHKYQMDLNNSVLTVEAQALALKYATLITPIEGVVTSIDAPLAGQNITPASATFNVVNPKTIYFSATADQTEIVSFTEGMGGRISLDSFPDVEVPATIKSISFVPKSGESGTMYEIKLTIDTSELSNKVRLGMTGDANFILKEIKDVLVVPEAYLKKSDGKYYVTKMVSGKQEMVEVKIGESIEGDVVITEGLNEKDVIYNQSK